VKASPEDQLRLLDVQADDAALDQLAHKRATLPDLALLASLSGQIARVKDNVVRLETQDADMAREQRKIEADVDQVRARVTRDEQRLNSGAGSAKDLEHTQGELASLARRQADLEDQVLEVMERREAVQTELAAEKAELDRLTAEQADATARRDAAYAEIDAHSARLSENRRALVTAIAALWPMLRLPVAVLRMMLTRIVCGRSAARSAAGSTRPSRSTGSRVTSKPSRSSASADRSTASCSIVDVITCRPRSSFRCAMPWNAKLSPSVPPEVKMTSFAATP